MRDWMIEKFAQCPTPRYWLCHAAVALVIMVLALSVLPAAFAALAGAGFYAARETRDYFSWKGDERVAEGLSRFDWPGFLAPTIAVALAFGAVSLLGFA
jgi:hypothetical protein